MVGWASGGAREREREREDGVMVCWELEKKKKWAGKASS